ncbi:MAG: 7-carboxy-7-deazaguanine synthase QueE [Candidatus Omnitrophica bacterium]|nr:7-carboxy-7-deazaguanine synthase QueE [Candidatus Omnitrophota bacterium]
MKARISEIFPSIQGEGKYTGYEQVFVRFFECNIRCAWCDTPSAIGDTTRHYKEYNLEELLSEVRDLWPDCHSVSLTGGEPLVQKDFIKALLPSLKKEGMRSYLETNGILDQCLAEIIDDVDIVAMDLKLPSSTKCRPYWEEHAAFLKVARQKEVFIKAVISSDTNKEDVARSVELIAGADPAIPLILQPNYFEHKNGAMDRCLDYQDYCRQYLSDVKVMSQMHKVWKIR